MGLAERFGLVAAVVVALSLAGCGNGTQASSSSVRQVVSTTSFGMCVGYCSTRLEISEGQAILERTAHGGRGGQDLPAQRFTAVLSEGEWQEIARLAQEAKLDGLPAVIGCPDCADGGAESLTIVRAGGTKTVSFDHGAAVKEALPLLDRVRALRMRLMPKS
jgi:hypothetical protein